MKVGIKKVFMSYHFGMHEEISTISKNIIIKNIENIHNYGLKVYLMTTLSKINYNMIECSCEKAHKLGVEGIIFNNYLLQGNALNDNDMALDENELKVVADEIEKTRMKYTREILNICKCGSLGGNKNSNHNHFKYIVDIDHAVITDNKVYPCFFLTKPGYKIGYFGGKNIIITNPIEHDGTECISYKISNKKLKQ